MRHTEKFGHQNLVVPLHKRSDLQGPRGWSHMTILLGGTMAQAAAAPHSSHLSFPEWACCPPHLPRYGAPCLGRFSEQRHLGFVGGPDRASHADHGHGLGARRG